MLSILPPPVQLWRRGGWGGGGGGGGGEQQASCLVAKQCKLEFPQVLASNYGLRSHAVNYNFHMCISMML